MRAARCCITASRGRKKIRRSRNKVTRKITMMAAIVTGWIWDSGSRIIYTLAASIRATTRL